MHEAGKTDAEIGVILNCTQFVIKSCLGSIESREEKARIRLFKKWLARYPNAGKIIDDPLAIKKPRPKILPLTKLDIKAIGFQQGGPITFNGTDLLRQFGENTACYLTGEPINLYQTETYVLDHKIPKSRGGSCLLENVGICTSLANMSKWTMTPEEFGLFCQRVIQHLCKKP